MHFGDELHLRPGLHRPARHDVAAAQAPAQLPRRFRGQCHVRVASHAPPTREHRCGVDAPELAQPVQVMGEHVHDPLVPELRIGADDAERQNRDTGHARGRRGCRAGASRARDPRQCHGGSSQGSDDGRCDDQLLPRSSLRPYRGRHPLQRVAELGGRAEPVGRRAGQRGHDRLLDVDRHGVTEVTDARRGLAQSPRDRRLRGPRRVRRLAREHLEEHAPQRVDVAPGVDRCLGECLLGRHVGRRADGEPGLGELGGLRSPGCAGDAEVGHQRASAFEQDVVGLDVAVDEVVAVRVGQRLGHLARDADRLRHGQLPFPVEAGTERLALDIRHDEEAQAVGLTGVVERNDVGVPEARGDADLALEALRSQCSREIGAQHLDRDGAIVASVLREVDDRHAAGAELARNQVSRREGRADAIERHHGGMTRRSAALPAGANQGAGADGGAGIHGRLGSAIRAAVRFRVEECDPATLTRRPPAETLCK